jgi:hypothetical protein
MTRIEDMDITFHGPGAAVWDLEAGMDGQPPANAPAAKPALNVCSCGCSEAIEQGGATAAR